MNFGRVQFSTRAYLDIISVVVVAALTKQSVVNDLVYVKLVE